MKKLNPVPIVETTQVEIMRIIYNENLDSLATKPLPYRTYDEQQKWWQESNHDLRAFLYEVVNEPSTYVGFMVLRNRGGFETPTIALRRENWERDTGRKLS